MNTRKRVVPVVVDVCIECEHERILHLQPRDGGGCCYTGCSCTIADDEPMKNYSRREVPRAREEIFRGVNDGERKKTRENGGRERKDGEEESLCEDEVLGGDTTIRPSHKAVE